MTARVDQEADGDQGNQTADASQEGESDVGVEVEAEVANSFELDQEGGDQSNQTSEVDMTGELDLLTAVGAILSNVSAIEQENDGDQANQTADVHQEGEQDVEVEVEASVENTVEIDQDGGDQSNQDAEVEVSGELDLEVLVAAVLFNVSEVEQENDGDQSNQTADVHQDGEQEVEVEIEASVQNEIEIEQDGGDQSNQSADVDAISFDRRGSGCCSLPWSMHPKSRRTGTGPRIIRMLPSARRPAMTCRTQPHGDERQCRVDRAGRLIRSCTRKRRGASGPLFFGGAAHAECISLKHTPLAADLNRQLTDDHHSNSFGTETL
jgi:hypothetical protein